MQVDCLSTGCAIILHSPHCFSRDDALLTNEALCVTCLFFMWILYSLDHELHASFIITFHSDSKLTRIRFVFQFYLHIILLSKKDCLSYRDEFPVATFIPLQVAVLITFPTAMLISFPVATFPFPVAALVPLPAATFIPFHVAILIPSPLATLIPSPVADLITFPVAVAVYNFPRPL